MSIIELKDVSKTYDDGVQTIEALKKTNLEINPGEFVAIVGPSGSGKSTLLTLLGGLQTASSGTIRIDQVDIASLDQKALSDLRFQKIGFVLQASNLVPYLTVKEQLKLKLNYAGQKNSEQKIEALFAEMNIKQLENKYPEQISGGERQRAAICAALVLEPKLILADEPTASLDTEKAYDVVELLGNLSKEQDCAVVMVTHDRRMLKHCDRVLSIDDGVLSEE